MIPEEVLRRVIELYLIEKAEIGEPIELDPSCYEYSDKFKKRMNRMFREQVGGDHALHPEVDNAYERIRSKIVRFFLVVADRIAKLIIR